MSAMEGTEAKEAREMGTDLGGGIRSPKLQGRGGPELRDENEAAWSKGEGDKEEV